MAVTYGIIIRKASARESEQTSENERRFSLRAPRTVGYHTWLCDEHSRDGVIRDGRASQCQKETVSLLVGVRRKRTRRESPRGDVRGDVSANLLAESSQDRDDDDDDLASFCSLRASERRRSARIFVLRRLSHVPLYPGYSGKV